MKKYSMLLVLVFGLVLSQLTFAAGPKFGVGGVLGFATGDWSDWTSSVAFGGTAQVLLPVGENLAVGAQAGYITFGGQKVDESIPGFGSATADYTISAIPILGIGRYYLGVPGGPRPFVGALVGFHVMRIDYTASFTLLGFTQEEKFEDHSTEFSFGPTAGIEIGAIELSAFYMLISDANYVGARIGFNFGAVE